MSYTVNTPYHGPMRNASSRLDSVAVPAAYNAILANVQQGLMPQSSAPGGMGIGQYGMTMPGGGAVVETSPGGYSLGIIPGGANYQFTEPAALAAVNQTNVPPSTVITVTSAVGAGAGATRVFLTQQDVQQNITDNGSGAGSIAYTFLDGVGGKNLSQTLADARDRVGAICFGGYIRMNVTAGGAGDPAGLALTNPAFLNANTFGFTTPTNINIVADDTRGDQDTSIQPFTSLANMSRTTQFSFVMPVGDTATVVLYFNPYFKR